MVHMMSTTRAGRPTKEKTPKTQHVKSDAGCGAGNTKHQPTAEQMRMANMIKSNKGADDPDLEAKIKQVADCTGRSDDDAYFALHDCDYDLSRAIEKLLENEDKGEWQEKKGKRKKQTAAKNEAELAPQQNDNKPERTERANDRDLNDYSFGSYERSSSAPRGRRNDRAPPRFQRAAAGRGKNEDDRGDSNTRDRGRGRGRGSRGRGRGRGGSAGPRRDFNDRNVFENGPQIDTWTNETADSKPESSFGTWGDMAEDWTNDEWTGSLKESKVFTPSAQESAKVFSNDNDAKMFSVTNIETQVFNSSLADSMPSPAELGDSTSRYQHSASPMQPPAAIGQDPHTQTSSLCPDPLSQDPLNQDPLSQSLAPKPIGQNPLAHSSMAQMGQRLDLGMLLGSKPNNDSASSDIRQAEELAKQTDDFLMAQFQKQATETIKNAVGIGASSPAGGIGLSQTAEPVMTQSAQTPSQQSPQEQRNIVQASVNQQALQQRTKRTKLPPPSKIPQSAVVMPGGMNYGSGLDVKFGTWEQGEAPGFSFGAVTTAPVVSSYTASATSSLENHMPTSVQNNHIGQQGSVPVSQKTEAPSVMTSSAVTSQQSAMSAMLDSMTQQTSQSPRPAPSSVFPMQQQKNTPSTPPKEYSQSTKISSPPEPIPFPPSSQTDRKSPYQTSGSLASEPAGSSYSQSSYSSGYSSSAYKSSVPASTSSPSYQSHQTSNSLSAAAGLTGQSGLNSYQSAAFQSQSGYSSQAQNSLYQSNNSPSSFQSSQSVSSYQPGSGYQSQSSGSGYQSTGYHSNRDSQSAPAFQSSGGQSVSYQNSVSQSAPSYQNTASQSSSSSYQRDSESQQSAYSSQSAYGSSVSTQKLSSAKLSDSISKLSVKDSTLEQSQSQFDSNSVVVSAPASLSTGVSTNSSVSQTAIPIVTGSVSVSAVLGLTTPTANVASGVSSTISLPSSKSSSVTQASAMTKAPPNLQPGVPPLIGQSMYIGQHGFPVQAFGLQQPALYSYEDLLLSQQRLPMHSYYDNLPFQPTPTTLTGMDHNKLAPQAAVTYNTGAPDTTKLNRVDAQSPTNTQTSQPQAQTQSTGQGQTFISPHSIPPGYAPPSYFYPAPPTLPGGYSYPPIMPLGNLMPQVTNAGGSTATSQYPKAATYGYGSGTATQDYNKAYVGASQSQSKGSVSAAASSVSSTSDLTAGASAGYPKTHSQAYDKTGFAAGTPPPFNITGLPTGSQAGPMGTPAFVQYVPGLAAQPQAQMLAHQLHQDGMGGGSRSAQQSSSQAKGLASKSGYGATAYWGTN